MHSENQSAKGPIISGLIIGAIMISPVVPSIASAFEGAADTSSRQSASPQEQLEAKGYQTLVNQGYHHVTLTGSKLKNPQDAYEGITMTFDAAAANSIDIGTVTVTCAAFDKNSPVTSQHCWKATI